MVRGIVIGIVLAAVVAFAAGSIVVNGGLVPVNADTKPSSMEMHIAMKALNTRVKHEAQGLNDPLPLNPSNLMIGMKLYRQNCSACHGGSDGKPPVFGKGEYPPPPMLAEDGVEDDPEGVTYWKVAHGIRLTGMPAFGASLSTDDMWRITQFVAHMDHLPANVHSAWTKPVPATM